MDCYGKTVMHPHAWGARMLSQDGYIRITPEEMVNTPLIHLISGLDQEEDKDHSLGATQTCIAGYTEWVSDQPPVITVGWDWRLDSESGELRYLRTSAPRSNIMFVDDQHVDLGPARTEAILEKIINALSWQRVVHCIITQRYQ